MTEDQWACAEPEPLKWDSDRLTVAVVSAVDGSPLDGSGEEEAVYNAIELANDQLSTHLSTTMNPATADIVVIWRAAFNVGAAEFGDETGYCRHRWEAGRLRAEMAVRPSGDIRCEYQTALHELGHCLGLGHDDWGIMRTNYVCNDREEDRMQPDFYGDQQVDLIETTYP